LQHSRTDHIVAGFDVTKSGCLDHLFGKFLLVNVLIATHRFELRLQHHLQGALL
uniref:Uncharacterized protein n=1 Tax=Parascaris univalens TaxID=6257 RepID=A0A915BXH2_PARUN